MRVLRCGLALLFALFIGHVMADDAAADCAEDAVMGHVAGDSADQRALQATLGFGGGWRQERGERHPKRRGHDECGFHCGIPFHEGLALDADLVSERIGASL
jgi:hypothetical protein